MKDNNFIFYFDAEGRIRLVEEACTFLKRISDCECYDYVNDKIYAYYGSSVGARRICLALYEGDMIKEKYSVYSLERCAYEKYVYNDDLLSYIETCIYEVKKEPRKWKQKFYFDKKNNLQLIQRVEGAWREKHHSLQKKHNLQKTMFNQTFNMENLVIGVNLNLENENIQFM